MNVLVLGGTSFIGPFVVRRLVELGHRVTVYHRGQTEANLPPEVRHIHGGWIEQLSDYRDEFEQLRPEVALYMIPIGEPDCSLAMQACKGLVQRLVGLSSVDVYRAYERLHRIVPGPPDPVPLTEDSPLRSKLFLDRLENPRGTDDPLRWADDSEKIVAERVLMDDPDMPGTILRLPMVYGPGDYIHRLFMYLKRMDDARATILLDEQVAQWRGPRGYVENVAWAITRAVVDDRAAGRIYNVAEPEALTELEWVRRIGQAAGWNGRIVLVPRGRLPEKIDHRQLWIVDSTRIRKALGYAEPVSPEEALRRTIIWERAHPPSTNIPSASEYAREDEILAQLSSPC